MTVVVAYDVNTASKEGRRRLRRVAQTCQDYGQRVQKSLFECNLRQQDWARLRARLLAEFNTQEDSLRFYFLDEDSKRKTEHHGIGQPIDLDGPLVV